MAASKPTSSLSVSTNNLHPLTLNLHYGTLTTVWIVLLSQHKFTPCWRLQTSTMFTHSELDKTPNPFESCRSNPSLYHANYLDPDLTTVNFGRNQLSRFSIGFLPLLPGQKNTCT